MTSDQSVPLSQAPERFSDQDDCQELCSLQSYEVSFFVLGAPETEYQRRHWRYHQLKERLEMQLLARLTAGSLQATGLVCPVDLYAERRLIPAARWQTLEPDFRASEAKGPGGLQIIDIQIEESQLAPLRSSHPSSVGQHVPREHAPLARLRADLRRWLEREARIRGRSWQKKHYCDAARTQFGDRVTNNLFNEVWRSAVLPQGLRRPGLRKSDQRSSPPT
jgi:hypothetical protein